jgi:hypothetical protein
LKAQVDPEVVFVTADTALGRMSEHEGLQRLIPGA